MQKAQTPPLSGLEQEGAARVGELSQGSCWRKASGPEQPLGFLPMASVSISFYQDD